MGPCVSTPRRGDVTGLAQAVMNSYSFVNFVSALAAFCLSKADKSSRYRFQFDSPLDAEREDSEHGSHYVPPILSRPDAYLRVAHL